MSNETMKRLQLSTLSSFLIFFISSCVNVTTTNNQDIYDFHILYSYQGDSMNEWFNTNYNSNNLYISIESGFNKDTISISVNGKSIVHDTVVQTDYSDGLAACFQIPDIYKTKQLSLKVNGSPTVSFEIARKDFIFIGVRKHENSIEIVFYKKPPRFD